MDLQTKDRQTDDAEKLAVFFAILVALGLEHHAGLDPCCPPSRVESHGTQELGTELCVQFAYLTHIVHHLVLLGIRPLQHACLHPVVYLPALVHPFRLLLVPPFLLLVLLLLPVSLHLLLVPLWVFPLVLCPSSMELIGMNIVLICLNCWRFIAVANDQGKCPMTVTGEKR